VAKELPDIVRREPCILDVEAFAKLVTCPAVPAVRRLWYLTAALALFRAGEVFGLRIRDCSDRMVARRGVGAAYLPPPAAQRLPVPERNR
jgi:hypothetical protein